MASPLITLHEATVAFQEDTPPAIERVSLAIERGSWTAIVGDNGSGKTTLLAAIGGVLSLRDGRIERAPGVRSALLLQEPDNQFVATSVAHELALSIPADVDGPGRRARLTEAIERYSLSAILGRNPHRLSGGEKQRLALATVWLEDPDVLLLDEPLAYLDCETRAQVVGFVRELNDRGVAIVWATPGGDDARLARDTVVLDHGRAVLPGPSGATSAGVVETGPGGRGAAGWRHDRNRTSGPTAAQGEERGTHAGAPVVLRFEGVSFAYDGPPVLRDLTFDLRAGECVGVTGANSTGKSTLLLVAGGALRPAAGRVLRDAGEHGTVYLPQSPERLFFAETVLEEVSFGLERRGTARAAARERAREALHAVSLEPAAFGTRSPFQLSFGEMRRVAFAIAAALEPRLLLLDEPASCLDKAGERVLDQLVGARTAAGGAVLVASHDLEHLGRLCERVLRLPEGRLE